MTDAERVRRLRFLANKVLSDEDLNKLCGCGITKTLNVLFLDVANRLEELSDEEPKQSYSYAGWKGSKYS